MLGETDGATSAARLGWFIKRPFEEVEPGGRGIGTKRTSVSSASVEYGTERGGFNLAERRRAAWAATSLGDNVFSSVGVGEVDDEAEDASELIERPLDESGSCEAEELAVGVAGAIWAVGVGSAVPVDGRAVFSVGLGKIVGVGGISPPGRIGICPAAGFPN